MATASNGQNIRKHSGPDFPVVGIGASAGGVPALLQLFEATPSSPGAAFVVVLHLSPDHASHAHDVIQNVTTLRVRQVVHSVPLEKNNVYVIPPGKLLSMVDGYLRLSDPEPPRLPPTSIDVFFRSLADAHGDRAIAVLLSGSGADGSVGIARVRERGGITIAQDPAEAEYAEMPRNAIATGDVDLVLPVMEIVPRLLELARNADAIALPSPSDPDLGDDLDDSDETALSTSSDKVIDDILDTLRSRTRHDFSNYKRGTIVRRIERRMQVNGQQTIQEYRQYLADTADETQKLLADLLIGVTNFFRDPEAFEALEDALRKELMRKLHDREEIRAWVPACATGEEAFSIAIILDELARRMPHRPRITVYASDVDEHAIAIARTGSYPAAIANDISEARLAQYFNKDGDRYRLVKSLRDSVIFAAHNLLHDPPFSRVDLVSCRNLLIYLDRRAQTQVLEAFHFSLRPNGLLFLSTAESADFAQDLFSPVLKQRRIYRAQAGATSSGLATYASLQAHAYAGTGQAYFSMPIDVKQVTALPPGQARSLELFGPPVIVIHTDGTIVHRSANAIHLTADPQHLRAVNLFDIVREDTHGRLRAAIRQCTSTRARHDEAGVPLCTASGEVMTDLSLRVYRDRARDEDLISITCDVLTPVSNGEPGADDRGNEETIDSLREALDGSEDRLRTSLENVQNSTEELRASNEELQAMNEELRSATEELEASREELQSLNEELVTVNSELLAKVQEAARVSDDLQNLIALVGVATVFVDRTLNIKRYTSPAETLFNILPGDRGRPLQHLTHRLDYPDMVEDLRAAFESLKKAEKEVRSKDGRTFLARVIPYRTDDDRIDGAVLALIDISEQKAAQNAARVSEEKLKLAAQETHDFAIILLDDQGQIVSWNVGATRIFGFRSEEMLGKPLDAIFTAEDVADQVPLAERSKARSSGRAEDERWHATKSGEPVYCSGFLSRIDVPGFSGFTKIVHDATRRKLMEGQKDMVLAQERADHSEVRKLSRLKDEFIAILSHELKNPLNLIHMKAEMLARIPEAQHIRRVQEVSDSIQKSVLTQAQIIDDLLDFSRIQTGKLTLRFAPIDMRSVVQAIVEAVNTDFTRAGVVLEVDAPLEPLIIHGDRIRLEQITWNLVTNALKFTPGGGKVVIRLQRAAVAVSLEVIDTGVGIATEAIGNIFDMFQQGRDVTSRARTHGLGIGLSLVRQLAELHGGRAEAFSQGKGQGTRFTVWLPTDASFAHRQAGDRPADLSLFANLRVLLVEDHEDSLQAMSDLFALYDARVTGVPNATQAETIARESDFDLVVTDVDLPDMDGYQLVRLLRQISRCADIPMVAVTGRPVQQEEPMALAAGCDACLAKPFNLQALAEVIVRRRPEGKL